MSEATIGHRDLANAVRGLAMDAVEKAQSGHPGMPMGMADVATVLFTRHLKFIAAHPEWPDRDRFVLSAGHGSMLLYALLHLTGYADMTLDELRNFRQLGSRTAGHPEYGHAFGIETTTGPLGQGLATSVGMALAERLLAARFGDELVDHRTWVIAGDGDLMEGVSHEAISLAGHLRLARLTVLFDDNEVTHRRSDLAFRLGRPGGPLQGLRLAVMADRRPRSGCDRCGAQSCRELATGRSMIACRTIIGKGAPTKAGKSSSPRGTARRRRARRRQAGLGLAIARRSRYQSRFALSGGRPAHAAALLLRRGRAGWLPARSVLPSSGRSPANCRPSSAMWPTSYKRRLAEERPSWATRKSSQEALQVLTATVPEMVGGSADLTHSNNTDTKATPDIKPGELIAGAMSITACASTA